MLHKWTPDNLNCEIYNKELLHNGIITIFWPKEVMHQSGATGNYAFISTVPLKLEHIYHIGPVYSWEMSDSSWKIPFALPYSLLHKWHLKKKIEHEHTNL
jgi:hypothetical protein